MFSKLFTKHNKALLLELIRTDFKLRYQGSALGYIWAILRPLFMFAILYAVFGLVLRFGDAIPNFPVYLLLGIVLWQFFTEATKQGMSSIVSKGDLMRKIHFPKYIVVISGTVNALINLMFNLVVVGIFLILAGAEVQWWAILVLPILLLELYAFSLAMAFFLATVNVRYRDIGHIWDILLQAGFYASAIFFPIGLIAERSTFVAQIILANPVAQVIHDARYALVTSETITITTLFGTPLGYLIPGGIIATVSCFAVSFFKKRSVRFAEDI